MQLKSHEDLAGIYASGMINGSFLNEVEALIKPGVTTGELNSFAGEFIRGHGAYPTFLDYRGFPGNICTSINDQIVHGIPGDRVLEDGDLLSIDVGVTYKGYISDSARTFVVGNNGLSEAVERLIKHTKSSLYAGIAEIAAGTPLRMVSRSIEQELKAGKLGIIRELTGHGVGFELHEEPTVYNFDPGGRRPLIENGLVLAIEPMATLGSESILLAADNWTYSTMDGSFAAHFEHTVACWQGRAYILTDPEDAESKQEFAR